MKKRQIEQLDPARARGRDMEGPLIAEEKIDGHRGLMHLGKDLDRMYLTGRRISKKTGQLTEKGLNVEHLQDASQSLVTSLGIAYTVLDGEIVLPGQPFEHVQSVMGALAAKANRRQQEIGLMHYLVFDVLFWDGLDVRSLPLCERHIPLKRLIETLEVGTPHSEYIYRPDTEEEEAAFGSFFDEIVTEGGEGIITKNLMAPYGTGWKKQKKAPTFDVVVMGFEDGAGKFRNMIGAVVFGAYDGKKLVEVGQCSGMRDGNVKWVAEDGGAGQPNRKGSYIVAVNGEQPEGTRAWFTQNQASLKGTVIEVKCNGVTKHGALRHPQFVRTRPDRDAKSCVLPSEQHS